MTSSGRWYEQLQRTRCVPPKRLSAGTSSASIANTDCYALSIRRVEFSNLKIGVYYRLHAYFFDKESCVFFGRPFVGDWGRADANQLDLTDVVFFHVPVKDESIVCVLELVECESLEHPTSGIFAVAWAVSPLYALGRPITDFSTADCDAHMSRFQFYHGSPKQLCFLHASTNTSDILRKANGVLAMCLQTHRRMLKVVDFVPEYCMISMRNIVPGILIPEDDCPQLLDPQLSPLTACVLNSVTLSFGSKADELELHFLEFLNNDRLYRANRSPNDKNVRPMQMLERRLRIGLHNGFTYVEEPQCFHLASPDEQVSGTQSLRKKARTLSRSTFDLRSEMSTLIVRNAVSLAKLTAHPNFAIVFSLDYLVGVKAHDGTVTSSQSVIMCWGAWCPFAGDYPSGTTVVPLTGGPRINPDETFAFKSVLRFRSGPPSDGVFGDIFPRIQISFRFSTLSRSKSEIFAGVDRADVIENTEIRREASVDSREGDIGGRIKENGTELNEEMKPTKEDRRDATILPAIPVARVPDKETVTARLHESTGKLVQTREADRALPVQYSTLTPRASAIPRSAFACLSNVSFATISDRNGNKPIFVDVENVKLPNVAIELNDRLNTSEVVVQFLALLQGPSPAADFSLYRRVFFSLRFYRFSEITTERLLVQPSDNANGDEHAPCVLRRIDNSGKLVEANTNGFTVKYMVDRCSLRDGEEDDLIRYLMNESLIIDVWNADSFMHIGTCCVPLRCLLRQGSEAVQCPLQTPVVQSSLPIAPEVCGILLMKIACVGHPSNRDFDLTCSRTSAIVSRRLERVGENEIESYRIRAKPLNPIHESAMQRFLTAQKFDIKQRYEEVFSEDSLRRIQNLRDGQSRNKSLMTKGSVKRFLFREELEAYKKLRNESKASKLLKAVFKGITTEHRISPSHGQIEFFEFLLQNTEPEAVSVVLEITEDRLRPVFDVDSWKFFKRAKNLHSPVEKDLFQVLKNRENAAIEIRIFLKAMESIFIPFIYDSFGLPSEQRKDEVKAIFKRSDSGEPIAILELLIENRLNVINQSFRFFEEAETKLTKLIRIPLLKDSHRVATVSCSDATALVSLRNYSDGSQDLLLSYHSDSAASLRTFTVYFYGDRYNFRLLFTWLFHLHSATRISVNAVQAQPTKLPLLLRTESQDHLIEIYSSTPMISVIPSQAFLSSSAGIQNVAVSFTPEFTGEKIFRISAVDLSSRQLINEWIVFASVAMPTVVNRFDVNVVTNRREKRQISITNAYGIVRTYRIVSSRPEVVRPDDEMVVLEAHKSTLLSLTFLPFPKPLSLEVLLFVLNAENDLQEETYSIRVSYSDE